MCFLIIVSQVFLGGIKAQGPIPAPLPPQPGLLGAWTRSSSTPGPAVSDERSDKCMARLHASQLGESRLSQVTGIVHEESAFEERAGRTMEISLTLVTLLSTENGTP